MVVFQLRIAQVRVWDYWFLCQSHMSTWWHSKEYTILFEFGETVWKFVPPQKSPYGYFDSLKWRHTPNKPSLTLLSVFVQTTTSVKQKFRLPIFAFVTFNTEAQVSMSRVVFSLQSIFTMHTILLTFLSNFFFSTANLHQTNFWQTWPWLFQT